MVHTWFVLNPVLCYKLFPFLSPTVHEVPQSAVYIVYPHVHPSPTGPPKRTRRFGIMSDCLEHHLGQTILYTFLLDELILVS